VDDKLKRLDAIGFTRAGCWLLSGQGLAFDLSNHTNARNILYAFVAAGQLMYIGKTVQALRNRMAGYKTPGPSQSTNINNHNRIRACLEDGKAVEILALPDNGLLHYGGFHINLAAGLEDSLVRELAPPWNGGLKETASGTLEPAITE
jgi:hypothetical protein